MTFKELQKEVRTWTLHNFGRQESWKPLLGIVEELGELAHSHLKNVQRIRRNENHQEKKKDAIVDIIIYLTNYCIEENFDLDEIVQQTWAQVKCRDWAKNPNTGKIKKDEYDFSQ